MVHENVTSAHEIMTKFGKSGIKNRNRRYFMGNLSKWLCAVLAGCLGTTLLFTIGVHADSRVPSIIIAQPNYNFGELSEMAPLSHNFIVKNNGKADLNIRDVQPG